jgi:hypothetical protein
VAVAGKEVGVVLGVSVNVGRGVPVDVVVCVGLIGVIVLVGCGWSVSVIIVDVVSFIGAQLTTREAKIVMYIPRYNILFDCN